MTFDGAGFYHMNIMIVTIFWTWIFNGAQQSILIASLTHATVNASPALVGTLLSNQPQQMGNTAQMIMVVCAALVILMTKGRLSYHPERRSAQESLERSQ